MKTNNELIAEFMGNKKLTTRDDNTWIISGQGMLKSQHFEYHTSWDWLMAVVEKIRLEVGANVTIRNNKCIITIYKKRFACYTINPLNSTYHAVVDFIKYFNDKKL